MCNFKELAQKCPGSVFCYDGKWHFNNATKIDDEGYYWITMSGEVYHYNRNRDKTNTLVPYKDSSGYDNVKIHGKNERVHRLVANAFVYNPNGYNEVHHKDGDKSNNCFCNLQWICRQKHMSKHFGKPVAAFDKNTKLLYYFFDSAADAGRQLNINASGIRDCCRERLSTSGGYIWVYIDDQPILIEPYEEWGPGLYYDGSV